MKISNPGMLARRTLFLFAIVLGLPVHGLAADQRAKPANKPAGAAKAASLAVAPGLVAGESFTLVLRPDGSLWGWGSNGDGQLALGNDNELRALGVADASSKHRPTLIGTGFVSIAAGDAHAVALKADGSLWTWGSNRKGQLGDGSDTTRYRPVPVGQGFVKALAGANQSFAIKADGSLWAWGANDFGQLGDGTRINRNRPVQIGRGFVTVATGWVHTVALTADGQLWAWGANADGQHGDGTIIARDSQEQRLSPVRVGDGYRDVAVSTRFTAAIKTDGTLWAWGENDHGRVGDGSEAPRASPLKVGGDFLRVAASSHVLALKTDGSLWSWGYNGHGQLGDGSMARNRKSPAQIGSGFAAVAAGSYHSVAVKTDGSIWSWGADGGLSGAPGAKDSPNPALVDLPLTAMTRPRP